ncbi:MAG: pyridoxamine 5'-phosphate oxidase family protein [Thermoleophilia bacterium]|nr:pyridoxamine 5'-phosphate oxidase family protein [Thermoleophilia bacterium]
MPLSSARLSGPLDRDGVAAFLDGAVIPLRLACVAPSGWPIVVSLWFARRGEELVCATQRSSSLVRALEHEPRCGFEVAGERPPYRGVRGRARVAIEPDEGLATLAELVTRYLGGVESSFARWLLGRDTPEVVLRLDPVEVSSWDYTRRMAG